MDHTMAHHKHGRISMGYNIATTVLECSEVQLFDYEVKVKMEAVQLPSGKLTRPKPPYARTTLRKELQCIRFNDDQIFHTAVMVCKGPETGISSIVVTYDPNDTLYREKNKFAKRTVASLACFMHHWLIQCGYCESTRIRLMRSFYVEKAQLVPQSSWDPVSLTATSHFKARTYTYLSDNARYDPFLRKQLNGQGTQAFTFVDMSDTVRKGLLRELGYKPDERGVDVGSWISGASALTGDGETVGASTVNSEATPNRILKTKEYAKQLADSRVQNAEQAAEINDLKAQMQKLTQMLAGINQPGSPHLSGSGAARPQDEGSGAAPQGT
jgi:aerobic-type carbon monoxide dehydrogenase small subunit (CoxS/CutS family)